MGAIGGHPGDEFLECEATPGLGDDERTIFACLDVDARTFGKADARG
jgi:hypothetical protein